MAGPTHGALTFRRADFGGGGVKTVLLRTRDLGTTASCMANPAGVRGAVPRAINSDAEPKRSRSWRWSPRLPFSGPGWLPTGILACRCPRGQKPVPSKGLPVGLGVGEGDVV